MAEALHTYDSNAIKTLQWNEHIRKRPGMYIGKLGSGAEPDDGIYVLLKEATDNSIDEHLMGFGKRIIVDIVDGQVTVRDYGRGIPLDKIKDCAATINTGGKYDSEAFQRSVGLNGVGLKAVNALSSYMKIAAFRDGRTRAYEFSKGECIGEDFSDQPTEERNGTLITFRPDSELFPNYRYQEEFVKQLLWNYAYLNTGLTLVFNGEKIRSENGLLDLLSEKLNNEPLCQPIHFKTGDAEIAFTVTNQSGVEIYSFVNGQYTRDGGTHEAAFRTTYIRAIREHYGKQFDPKDIVAGVTCCFAVRIQDPVFESQTKTKLGSDAVSPGGQSLLSFAQEFLAKQLDDYLHINKETEQIILERILAAQTEREELQGLKKVAKKRERQTKILNKKLRDCHFHLTDKRGDRRLESTIFITEGDSASGSITTARDPETQAVFSLRGKPRNCFGLTKKALYENEEFYMLQDALGIEEGIENLRYNRVVIASDADSDGYHIRLLCCTYFLQFFPEMVRKGHLYFLETPLYRVRNKKETIYCYSDDERDKALGKLGAKSELTRFKGLGEVTPDEFRQFIGPAMRLKPVVLHKDTPISLLLRYYMGDNTPERQQDIIAALPTLLDTPAA